ncbi:MAG: dehydrogenase subunit [Thermoplasmata archaeon]|jgi:NADH-quinone oxidoreductase subunit K|nr:dehydrogenase subunit [Thermoplasmata archaeon]
MVDFTIQTSWYFILSAAMFGVGLYGVVTQKSGIRLLMSIEIMLNAANINFVAFGAMYARPEGFVYALFVIAIAAAEAAVGLAIFVNLFRVRKTIELDQIKSLQG